jgi:hypothetical protein
MARGLGQRYKARTETFCQALAMNLTPEQAGQIAGYKGAANARRNAQLPHVKKRVAELSAPAIAKIEEAIIANKEWATRHCVEVANKALPGEPKVADGLQAIRLAGQMNGWMPLGDSDGDGKMPTVIKFQLNIFGNQAQERVIEHDAGERPKP